VIELFLFENDAAAAPAAIAAGIRHFLVDWETLDKADRQRGFDTEIRPGTLEDLRGLAAVPGAEVWCRLNHHGPHTAAEVERAVAAGARGLFLPMVTARAEVEDLLRRIDGRCQAGILVETLEACAAARSLAELPLQRVYFGLNDFAISRGGGSIFRAVRDGTVARVREWFREAAFGFGGMTAVGGGSPVPAELLLQEMARLDCRYTFLRRSFRRDVTTRDPAEVVGGIQRAWERLRSRDPAVVRADRHALEARLDALGG
jgi:hypothetical protein